MTANKKVIPANACELAHASARLKQARAEMADKIAEVESAQQRLAQLQSELAVLTAQVRDAQTALVAQFPACRLVNPRMHCGNRPDSGKPAYIVGQTPGGQLMVRTADSELQMRFAWDRHLGVFIQADTPRSRLELRGVPESFIPSPEDAAA